MMELRNKGVYNEIPRIIGISTTDITGRILDLIENQEKQEVQKNIDPPNVKFLSTSQRLANFSNNKNPGPNDTIIYIQGSFDLLHHGHLKRLEEAKKLGDYLYVGIWDDQMVKYYKGNQYPLISLQERILMCLSCKHVDDVVIGAPYIITQDLLKSLNIKKVVKITNTLEDRPQD